MKSTPTRLKAVAAAIAGACALVLAGAASADVYVMVQDGTAYQLNSKDQPEWTARPESGVVGAAFDGTGRLWLAQQADAESECSITSPSVPGVRITASDIVYPGGTRFRNITLCWLRPAPGQTLLVVGDNLTAGSSVLYQLDLNTLSVRRLARGYLGAVGPAGQLAFIRHIYFPPPRYGTWEGLLQGTVANPGRARVVVRAPRDRSSDPQVWSGPSYSPSGRFAVVRDGRTVVGTPGRWTAVGPRGKGAGATAWDSTGDLYVVTSYPTGGIYRIPGGRPGPSEQWASGSNIDALAIGPDAPGAPIP